MIAGGEFFFMEESAKRILIDTNVFIALEEAGRVLDDVHADLLRLCRELHYDLYCHPAQMRDLERDKDDQRKKIQVSRLRSYLKLDSPPEPSSFDLMSLDWKQNNDNDRVDNLLLFALQRGAVSYLITEDQGMHRKAKRAGIESLVFTAEDFLSYLNVEKRKSAEVEADYVRVQTVNLYGIPVEQHFFDSLRGGYGGASFDSWYKDKASKGRKAWIVGEKDNLDALCIFKPEGKDERITDAGVRLPGKVLKLCTFKVAKLGRKLGERLLFVAFNYAIKNNFEFVYIQVNDSRQPDLVTLLKDFGFIARGPYNSDTSYVKDMRSGEVLKDWTPDERLKYDIEHFPHFDSGGNVKKILVPIQPTFHDRLFPDLGRRDYLPGFYPEDASEANAIKKAYICGSGYKRLEKGDLLFFYRSRDCRSIYCVGVVEAFLRSDKADEIIPFVARRTVFFDDEIAKMTNKGEQLAILFRVAQYLKCGISWSQLKKAGMKGPVQTIRTIDETVFRTVIKPLIEGT